MTDPTTTPTPVGTREMIWRASVTAPSTYELVLGFSDDGIAIGSYGPVALTVLSEPSTVPRLGQLRRYLERFRTQWPKGTYSISVLGHGSIIATVPAEIRDESTAIARDFPSLGSTIVVEGSGFGGAAIRAFLAGLFLVARNRSQIHANVPEAATWLARRIGDGGQYTMDIAKLIEATEQARSRIARRGV